MKKQNPIEIDMNLFRKFRLASNKLIEVIDAAFFLRASERDCTVDEIEEYLKTGLENTERAQLEFEKVKKLGRKDLTNYYPGFLSMDTKVKEFREAYEKLNQYVESKKS